MANEKDTDRLASELLGALMGSLTKPMAGTGKPQSQPQVDQGSMLNTIKDFLNQSLPGTKPQPGSAPAAQPATAGSQTWGSGQAVGVGGWEAVFRRQGEEREAMFARQEQERQEMESRHVREMETAMGAESASGTTAATYRRRVQRPTRQWGQTGGGLV